jgi:glutaredoxin
MKKIFLIFIAIFSFSVADDFYTAFQKAKSENKQLIMILKTQTCPYCHKLAKELNQKFVNETLSKDYNIVFVDRNDDKFPKELYNRFVPVSYFINPKTNEVTEQIVGYADGWKFLQIAKSNLQNKQK